MTENNRIWEMLATKLTVPTELPTIPKSARIPKWFIAVLENDCIAISVSKENSPSCAIKGIRKISQTEFESILPFYYKRKDGEKVSAIVTNMTRNQVYIYSIIHHMIENNRISVQ